MRDTEIIFKEVMPEIGEEFTEVEGIDGPFYVKAEPGRATHYYNGERIVPIAERN